MNLPQVRLEPLLTARAEELSPGRIRFGHELTDLQQDEHGVQALIWDNASGREYVGRAAYLIGANGGRLVHRLIGVEYEGLGMITQTATLYVSAIFWRCAPDPGVLIRWIYSPQAAVLVVIVPMRPERWGPDSEEWVIHLNYPVDDPRAQSDAQVEADARRALRSATCRCGSARSRAGWSTPCLPRRSAAAARSLSGTRHTATPDRRAGPDQRDPRRAEPVLEDRRGTRRRRRGRARRHLRSRATTGRRAQLPALVGERAQPLRDRDRARRGTQNSAEQNMALLRRMWSGRPEDAELRSSALRAMRAQSMEFSELNVEYGHTHGSAAVVPDDSPAPEPADDIRVYEPSTRPGAPLPHSASRRDLRRDGRSATPRLVAMMAPSLPTCLGTITSNRPTSSRALR
jgi:2,4-dichlorophenol 6-monooxygenase